VDLVIVAGQQDVLVVTLEAAQRGLHVLVVIRSRRAPLAARLRRSLRAAGTGLARQVTVLTGSEVVCVGSVRTVEAVVIRRIRTGRLIGVNASAIVGHLP
jgi:hypothetical protein